MRKRLTSRQASHVVALLILAFQLLSADAVRAAAREAVPPAMPVQAFIRMHLTGDNGGSGLTCQGELLCGIQLLPQAYREKDYRPLWIDDGLHLDKANALVAAIAGAAEDGLNPADYHLAAIQTLLAGTQKAFSETAAMSNRRRADLDLMLTDAFLLYGSHLAAGRVNPETLNTDWIVNSGPVDLLAALNRAVSSGNVSAAIASLRPHFSGYHQLRDALKRLRAIADNGGWPSVPPHRKLRPGDHDAAVAVLRQRLIASGDLASAVVVADETLFDAPLTAAVENFQRRNGLTVDGIVGRNTDAMLNVSVEQRIRQVAINLERWRWRPPDPGDRHLLINTADFNLKAVDGGRVALTMRVVVGRPARRSPVFSASMTYVVINPYWNVPRTIAVEDILPEVRKDVGYLSERGIRVFASWREDAPELDPATVDWQHYDADRFPFRLRQDPGPYNALGRIKFMFPNPFAVYLHDTPNRSLFRRAQRDFSSGCIRVEAPLALAAFVLAANADWPPDRISAQVASGETLTIRLARPLPVHLLYMTAWVDDTGRLQFRRDIYRHDRDLQQAFNRRRPDPARQPDSRPGMLGNSDPAGTTKGNPP